MRIRVDLAAIKKTKWYEYSLRFCLGGAITLAAGLLAERFGPAFGGLFLAFPAIFPASATLIENHERRRKRKLGIQSTTRGRKAAALDGRGAILGSFSLVGFAVTVWKGLSNQYEPVTVIAVAAGVWLLLSILLWFLRRKF